MTDHRIQQAIARFGDHQGNHANTAARLTGDPSAASTSAAIIGLVTGLRIAIQDPVAARRLVAYVAGNIGPARVVEAVQPDVDLLVESTRVPN